MAIVVLGLGNPGSRYQGTRHNIGVDVLAALAERWSVAMNDRRDVFTGGAGSVAGTPVYLAVSGTFMNLSGSAVQGLMNKMNRTPENLIVVHDDMDLPLGRVRLKNRGGDGGHRGIRSIQGFLGGRDFMRVRIGVGRPDTDQGVVNHVLGRFHPDDADAAKAGIAGGADAVECLLRDGFIKAQAHVHTAS